MRLLLVSSLYPPHVGGAERQAQRLARALSKLGVRVTVLTQPAKSADLEEIDGDIHIYRALAAISLGPVWGVSYMLYTWLGVERFAGAWDIAHSQQVGLHTYPLVRVAKRLGRPVVLRFACAGPRGDLSRLCDVRYGRWLLPTIRTAQRNVVLSETLRYETTQFGFPAERTVLIPNGVDTILFRPRVEVAAPSTHVKLLFIGRLDLQKGLDVLLDALVLVPSDFAWQLRIVGDGPERARLRDKVAALALNDRVTFLGYQDDVLTHYHWADLFILPSHFEGMPNVVLEAMACGLPVIGSNIGGTRDVVTHGETGWLVPRGNAQELAAAIVDGIRSQARFCEMGKKARTKVKAQYSIAAVASRYLAEYEHVLRESASLNSAARGSRTGW